MTARLMESRPASALDHDALRDAADEYINARARELLQDSERVAGYIGRLQHDEDVVAVAMTTDIPELLGVLVLQRINELAQDEAETEWENGE